MNETTELHIREWYKSDTVFEMRGWSSEKGQVFVVDANKRRQVIRFVLPGLLARGGAGIGVTFPRAAPTRITETCLLPPPCRATEKEAECLRAAAAVLRSPYGHTKSSSSSKDPNWELVWLRHRDTVLLPEPGDYEALIQQLVVFKAKQRETYEACRQELEEWGTKTIGQMIINGGGRYYRKLRNCKPAAMPKQIKMLLGRLETIYTRPLREFDGRLHGGSLNWTLDVARHEALVRNPVLEARWAASHNFDLVEMKSDKEAFLKWYRAHCPAPAHRAVAGFLALIPPAVWAHSADTAICAEVRFVADFLGGSRLWLAECPAREPLLTAEEQRPFEAPAPVTAPASNRLQSPPPGADHLSAALAAAEALAKAGQQARADVEAGASTLRARTKDLAETLGKVAEVFADPLVAAARDASIKRDVPEVFAWWVFQKWHSDKFPTVDGAFKGSRLGPKLKEAGLAFSRATVHRWLTIIREEVEKRGLMQKRRSGLTSDKARNFDVVQAKDGGPLPGGVDEPPEEFVQWVEDRDEAGAMPTTEDVLAYVRKHATKCGLTTFSEVDLKDVADKWLTEALKILNAAPTSDLADDNRNDPQDGY